MDGIWLSRKIRLIGPFLVALAGLVSCLEAFKGWSRQQGKLSAIEPQQFNSLGAPAVGPIHQTIERQGTPSLDQSQIAHDLRSSDADVRQNAIWQTRALATTDLRTLSLDLPQWVGPLIDAKDYNDLEQFALPAILERPYDPVTVQSAQRGRVLALIAEQKYTQALKEAKSFYNITALADSAEAIDLLSQVLRKTNSALAGRQVETEQANLSLVESVLQSIEIDPKQYQNAIQAYADRRNSKGDYSHNNLMARGDLLLLSDRPAEARECFQAACMTEPAANKNLRLAVEGVAKTMRAQYGRVAAADAFIVSLREHPAEVGAALSDSGSPPPEELRIAAQQTALSQVSPTPVPELELERARAETGADPPVALPRIVTGFEGSTPVYATVLSPTHVVVEIMSTGLRDWFMFQIQGAAGKTMRIDITGAYKTVPDWANKNWSLNPVFAYVSNPDDPAAYSTSKVVHTVSAHNGPILPDTSSQSWHYASEVWNDEYTLSFVQHFDSDTVCVAMRIPRTPVYNDRFFDQLAFNPWVKVVEVGRSRQNRPLLVAQIGTPGPDKPCVLLYAQEHADEQDAGWVTQGAIEDLLTDSPAAERLRQHFAFLVIPTLDPDAAASGKHQVIISSFLAGHTTQESLAYSSWFQHWINSGNRLDLVVDLHNIQSGEGPHIFCALIEGVGPRGATSMALHRMIVRDFQDAGYGVQVNPLMRGWMPDRLGGWLSHCYGPLAIAYEVNSQAPERHLNLAELKGVGEVFVNSIGQFFGTPDGKATLAIVDSRRQQRLAEWANAVQFDGSGNAITSEAATRRGADLTKSTSFLESSVP
jgi:zinc carboxypeptidase